MYGNVTNFTKETAYLIKYKNKLRDLSYLNPEHE